MMDTSLLFKAFVIFPNQGTISSLLEPRREGFYFSSKGDLMEVSKEAHVMFQAECVGNVYVAEFGGYSWWIAVILDFKSDGCGTIGDYDGFELRCSIVPQREIETRRATR